MFNLIDGEVHMIAKGGWSVCGKKRTKKKAQDRLTSSLGDPFVLCHDCKAMTPMAEELYSKAVEAELNERRSKR